MVSDQMMVLPQTIVSPKSAALPQMTLLFVAFGSPLSMNATPPAVTVCPAMTVWVGAEAAFGARTKATASGISRLPAPCSMSPAPGMSCDVI